MMMLRRWLGGGGSVWRLNVRNAVVVHVDGVRRFRVVRMGADGVMMLQRQRRRRWLRWWRRRSTGGDGEQRGVLRLRMEDVLRLRLMVEMMGMVLLDVLLRRRRRRMMQMLLLLLHVMMRMMFDGEIFAASRFVDLFDRH